MVDIDQGSVYITTGSLVGDPATSIDSGTTVQINTTEKIDYILQNGIVFIPIPLSKGSRATVKPYSRAIDLKRITETISIQGFLAEETNERAITKRNNLITFAKEGGELTVVWGLGNYQTVLKASSNPKTSGDTGAFIMKLQFTETAIPEMVGEPHSSDVAGDVAYIVRSIAVQIQLGRGKDM